MNAPRIRLSGKAGFTLIEMVGVLAIMAIMAAVIAPSAFHSLDEAAVRAEAQSLSNMGSQLALYARQNGAVPPAGASPPADWATVLSAYSGLSTADINTNSRQNSRVYLTDPASPSQRVLILSSMRQGFALPTSASITTPAQFDQIWQTADGSVPPSSSWAGWSAWGSMAASGSYLVIQRVSLAAVLQTFTLTLNNLSGVSPNTPSAASYNLVLADGTVQSVINISAPPVGPVILANQPVGVRLNLYSTANGVTPNYSYVISTTSKTFNFDGVNWTTQ